MIMKWKLADSLAWIRRHRLHKAVKNNTTFNRKMRFIPNHPTAPALQVLLRRLVEELAAGDLPDKCRRPIPAGAQRDAQSWRTSEADGRPPKAHPEPLSLFREYSAFVTKSRANLDQLSSTDC
jgi:hypothetical protein